MSDFQRVLDTTERHLLALRAAGVRFLSIRRENLSQLREPPPVFETHTIEPIAPPLEQLPQSPVDTDTGMAALRQRASVCLKCPHLAKTRRNVVFGVGDIHAQLMFVGEAPGA